MILGNRINWGNREDWKRRMIELYFALSFCALSIGDDSPIWAVNGILANGLKFNATFADISVNNVDKELVRRIDSNRKIEAKRKNYLKSELEKLGYQVAINPLPVAG